MRQIVDGCRRTDVRENPREPPDRPHLSRLDCWGRTVRRNDIGEGLGPQPGVLGTGRASQWPSVRHVESAPGARQRVRPARHGQDVGGTRAGQGHRLPRRARRTATRRSAACPAGTARSRWLSRLPGQNQARYGGRLSSASGVSASERASSAEEWKPRAFPTAAWALANALAATARTTAHPIANLRRRIGLHCREQGYRLVTIFCDRGFDTADMARPGFAGLLDALWPSSGHVTVFVRDLGHLSSDPLIREAMQRALKRQGAVAVELLPSSEPPSPTSS